MLVRVSPCKCRNEMDRPNHLCRVYKTKCSFVVPRDKSKAEKTLSLPSCFRRQITSKPAHEKKFHTLRVSRDAAIRASVTDIGMVNSKYTGIPIRMRVLVLILIFT